mmetsp:Transcript_25048/g.41450  ORF Transcript_25048/g.41450 Transcript_25048/m.41450 type:complete len:411 (+) Transcript_25048:194-1426(+)|eukprot:CAMPEP_0194576710 /NCGR_PEP_ID=MMETSP0292-20121207/11743_1 /TAXON_ID=39354 /ORGANISM="Heterosigma akashiwo, Strain CCMP2393" /LENGTH=410 /DNA_ID=CAMNT_0039428867 /DNA_START=45 /DNA_END=1277 /DNA_ORIENTATION=-
MNRIQKVGSPTDLEEMNSPTGLEKMNKPTGGEWERWQKKTPADILFPDGDPPVPLMSGEITAGILMFAYGDPTLIPKFLTQAKTSAMRFKQYNPGLSIVIVTNADRKEIPDVFDFHIPVARSHLPSQSIHRQWHTRIKYMALTPFNITLMLDATTISCTEQLSNLLQGSEFQNFDVAVQTEGLGTIRPHNCVIVYRNTAATMNMLKHWDRYHQCAKRNQDDQDTLQATLLELSLKDELAVGVLLDNFATALVSRGKENLAFPRLTHLLYPGAVHVMHSSYLDPDATCELLHSQIHAKRVIWANREGDHHVMRSLALEDHKLLDIPQGLTDSLVRMNFSGSDNSMKGKMVVSLNDYILSLKEYQDSRFSNHGSGYQQFITRKLAEQYSNPHWPKFGECAHRNIFYPIKEDE